MKKIAFITGLSIVVLFSCNGNIKGRLIEKIEHTCDKSNPNCEIAMKDVTKFEWQRMYVFGSFIMPDSISRAIKLRYDGEVVPDDCTRILFTSDKSVVYEEDLKNNDRSSVLYFNEDDNKKTTLEMPYFTPATAMFSIKKEKKSDCKNCHVYYLTPEKM